CDFNKEVRSHNQRTHELVVPSKKWVHAVVKGVVLRGNQNRCGNLFRYPAASGRARGTLSSRSHRFFGACLYCIVGFISARDVRFYAVVTISTRDVTLLIHRAEHGDAKAMHAKAAELL